MNEVNILEELGKKKAFVYEIDGELFYLGQWTCVKADPSKTNHYKKYRKLISDIGDNYDNVPITELEKEFRKLVLGSHHLEEKGNNDNLKEFIDTLPDTEKESLVKQIDDLR